MFGKSITKNSLIFFVLGCSCGLPLTLVFGSLSYWLKGADVSLQIIGWFSLARLPYSFKFLWAPFVDTMKSPFGKGKKAWALFFQTGLLLSIILMSFFSVNQLWGMGICAFLIAFFSASQDIVIDALRIEVLHPSEQGAGVASYQLGYRLGMLIAGAGGLLLSQQISWNGVYLFVGALGISGMLGVLMLPKTENVLKEPKEALFISVRKALKSLTEMDSWKQIFLFIVLYKLSNAFLGVMASSFYLDTGYSKAEIAAVSNIWGTMATITGTVLGSILIRKTGLFKALMGLGFVEILTSLAYCGQALIGKNVLYLTGLIAFDNIVGGLGATVFVTYLSSLCSKKYAATEYAVLSALAVLARDMPASQSGVVAHLLGWPLFFVFTGVLMIPALMMGFRLKETIQHPSSLSG